MFELGMIYTVGFTTLLFSFLLWIFFSAENVAGRIFRFLTIIGGVIWAVSLILFATEVTDFLQIFFRDVFMISMASFVLISTKSNKIISAALLLGAAIFYQSVGFAFIQKTFEKIPMAQSYAADGEIMVYCADQMDHDLIKKQLQQFDISLKPAFAPLDDENTFLDEVVLLDIPDNQIGQMLEITEILNQIPEVTYWEMNENLILEQPKSVKANKKSTAALNDPLAGQQWMVQALKVEAFHDLIHQNADRQQKVATVAILDSGIDGEHPDLKEHLINPSGKDYRDAVGHGTHVAGIVGAITNNKIGISSLLPGNSDLVKLQSFKVMNDFGMGTQQNVVAGMIAAADQGVDVISMSLGGKATPEREKIYKEAVEYCRSKGCIIVTSAGNANTSASTFSPTNSDNVIVVSGINSDLKKAYFSNVLDGIEWGVAAPGQQILSTYPKRNYKAMNGTSMSAPFVSALVGVMRAFQPDITDKEVINLLTDNGMSTNEVSKIGPIIQPSATLKALLIEQL